MASLNEVMSAFKSATSVEPTHLAGALLVVCAGVGGVLALTWVFQVGQAAMRGSTLQASQMLLLVIAAFLMLLITLGVFYR